MTAPVIWSHRGRLHAAATADDNTPQAFARAAAAGVAGVELDTWLTTDNHWVVMHDPDTLAGPVYTLSRAQVTARPDLESCLRASDVDTCNVEIKVPPNADREMVRNMAESMVEVLRQAVDRGRCSPKHLVISSFELALTDRLAELLALQVEDSPHSVVPVGPGVSPAEAWNQSAGRRGPDLRVARLCLAPPGLRLLEELATRGYWGIHASSELFEASSISAVHAAGLAAVAWTVNDAEHARRLASAGVDVLISDEPLLLQRM